MDYSLSLLLHFLEFLLGESLQTLFDDKLFGSLRAHSDFDNIELFSRSRSGLEERNMELFPLKMYIYLVKCNLNICVSSL